MKRFISTEFFLSLKEASQKGVEADTGVLKNGYDEFVRLLFTESVACTDKTAYYRSLAYTRLELECMTGVAGEKYNPLS
jgi:hypothetical protein